jgi:predicted AAA+ superfamily ATPase
MVWIERDIEDTLRAVASERPVLLLTGARQTGKTSLLRRVFQEHGYVSLDLPRVGEEADESFLAANPPPIIIDEVPYAPGLFRYLKAAVDAGKKSGGGFLLTGSQKFPLMQGVSESLAGRVGVVECHGLSLSEIERWRGAKAEGNRLLEWIFLGGYPEVHAANLAPERFFADYMATYLERDVRQVINVRSLRDFDRFLRLAALRSGQILSLNSMASDAGVSPNTVKSWLSVLEASNIIYLLHPYYRNLGKRLVEASKLYFLDTGLCCFLAGLRRPAELASSGMLAAIFETHVLSQMIKWWANRGLTPNIYFFRDHHGHEVDFVVPVGEKVHLFECKWAESASARQPGFDFLARTMGDENILSKSLANSGRRRRILPKQGVVMRSSVAFPELTV